MTYSLEQLAYKSIFFLCLYRTSFHKLSEASFLAVSPVVEQSKKSRHGKLLTKKKKRTWKLNKKEIVLVLQENFIRKATQRMFFCFRD